jgi:type VI secretion system protein ImpG
MDPRLLRHYDQELKYIREMGAEFAQAHPKIAGRLGLEGLDCMDPYVERLLEGFAFLTARVQLELELGFPKFTEQLLSAVYPHFLSPTPSMAVAEFQPELAEAALATGFRIPRGTMLRTRLGKDDVTPCEYRTAHEVTLWPLQVTEARYYSTAAALGLTGSGSLGAARAGLRLKFKLTAGLRCEQLALSSLDVHLTGVDQLPFLLHEHLCAQAIGFVARAEDGSVEHYCGADSIQPQGFDEEQALLPATRRSFSGYRLLQEYFALPERLLFVRFDNLRPLLAKLKGKEFELLILFNQPMPAVESLISAANFRLACTPIVNLIERRADRIHLNQRDPEYHVVVDRTRPMDFEVVNISEIDGFATNAAPELSFKPFYGTSENTWHGKEHAYFTLRREPRVLSERQRRFGARTNYVSSEVYVSLVDSAAAPLRSDLRQIECRVTCTNRDLPLLLSIGKSGGNRSIGSDFQVESGAPVEAIRIVGVPSKPREATAQGETAWRLVSHLSLNYSSLLDQSKQEGAAALREMLLLYSDAQNRAQQRQVEGVQSISTSPIVARLANFGPISVGRGLLILLTLDDAAFDGGSPYLLGSVLEQFFARYVSINSFTQTVLRTTGRGEIKRWMPRTGRRPTI